MKLDKETVKQLEKLILFTAVVILAVLYSSRIWTGIRFCIGILTPFLVGCIVAFVLNIPLCWVERDLRPQLQGTKLEKACRPLSIFLSLLLVVLVLIFIIAMVAPQIGQTTAVLAKKIPLFAEEMTHKLEQISITYPQIQSYVEELETMEINWESVFSNVGNFLKSGMTDMVSSTVSIAGSVIGGVVKGVISFIFAIYILGQKEKLANQSCRILSAYFPERLNRYLLKVGRLLSRNFSLFITGQCKEALILGSMFVISMSIFRMPYALMVGVLIAFTALIPIVGAFIGCAVGAFLILVDNPMQALWFVVLFLVLQQIEGNLIYPRVVGSSVGLPSIWVLAAVSIGGSLFGVLGMLFFIPLVSTIYVLLRDSVNERNRRKTTIPVAPDNYR